MVRLLEFKLWLRSWYHDAFVWTHELGIAPVLNLGLSTWTSIEVTHCPQNFTNSYALQTPSPHRFDIILHEDITSYSIIISIYGSFYLLPPSPYFLSHSLISAPMSLLRLSIPNALLSETSSFCRYFSRFDRSLGTWERFSEVRVGLELDFELDLWLELVL